MKKTLIMLILSSIAHAVEYKEAEVTRVHQDVRVLRAAEAPRTAVVGEKLTPVTSIATGAASRAELRFPDQSLTRLGANSRFTLKGEARTLDLDHGVMLLQVPKGRGGAKVRTATVTAAVTGTTVMFEYMPNGYIKLIVIEGIVDLYFNDQPGRFSSFTAGQMLIMKPDATSIPEPVDIDLKTLLKTSKLINGNEEGLPNQNQVQQAVNQQNQRLERGRLEPTPLTITGRGTTVSLNQQTRADLFRNFTLTPGGGAPPSERPSDGPDGSGGRPGGQDGDASGGIPVIAGRAFINETTSVRTNPHIDVNTNTGRLTNASGLAYSGAHDGLFQERVFGRTDVIDPFLQQTLNEAGSWAVFKFGSALINGTPDFTIGGLDLRSAGISNVAFATEGDLMVGNSSSFPGVTVPPGSGGDPVDSPVLALETTPLASLMLYSDRGDVIVRSTDTAITGHEQDLLLVAAGLASDVIIEGGISLTSDSYGSPGPSELTVVAGRDVRVSGAVVEVDSASFTAGRDVEVNEASITANNNELRIQAKRHIRITNSSQLKALTAPGALLVLSSTTGNIDVIGSDLQSNGVIELTASTGNINLTNSMASADVFKAHTLGTNGWITIGGTTISAASAIKLYAEGAGNAGVRFVDNTTLNSPLTNIAGRTVEILPGKSVESTGAVNVYADTKRFNTPGAGNFTQGGTPAAPGGGSFSSRPAY
ncbi:MAG: FecR domain-containing protein [Verrucomicrobiaceae bacterium]|nr:FecR domain-containing protein [Verrucomicrobiaceae bacterium]